MIRRRVAGVRAGARRLVTWCASASRWTSASSPASTDGWSGGSTRIAPRRCATSSARAWSRRSGETGDRETVATISLVYDHHARLLPGRLMAAQHRSYAEIVSALHVHMDADHCLEVLVVRGPARRLRALADRLIATRGVKHGRLTLATTGRDLG